MRDPEMPDKPKYKFRITELDPNLLARPFGIQTKWHVITGASCTGKTTLIDQLAGEGFQTVPEVARQVFDPEMDGGRTIEEIRTDFLTLEHQMTAKQIRVENGLAATEVNFLDRALPDSLTFYRVFGANPNELLPECFRHRYASVFILDRLPFHRTMALGPEDDATSNFLNKWLASDYRSLGYTVVRVPVLPPQERLAFVLGRLSK